MSDCKNCGQCCRFMIIEYTGFDQEDWKRWANYHQGITAYEEKGRKFLRIDSQCSMLKENGDCAIYNHRPEMCKIYNCNGDKPR